MNSLVCSRCEQSFPADDIRWQCDCGGVLDLEFTPRFDLAAIASRPPGMWRYRQAIPVQDDGSVISLGEGFTPLTAIELAGRTVLVKQEHLFPTGSFKDRGASVLVSRVRELGIAGVVEDSSGNAGCAIAAYCARAGIQSHIYVPRATSLAKLAQIRMYGAELHLVSGPRAEASRAARVRAGHLFYASHVWNPYFLHGTKTFAYECSEQLGWKVPDTLVLPVGNGTLLLGAALGFRELLRAGVTDRMPRLVGVQVAACAPLHKALHQGLMEPPVVEPRETLAEGIAIPQPVRGGQILRTVRETGGTFIAVSEAELTIALKEMGTRGFFIEPSAAVAMAGLKKVLVQAPRNEVVVSAITGHGLKAIDRMARFLAAEPGA